MTAKYATTCAVCASGIRPGEEIGKSGGGWAHEPCAGPAAEASAGGRSADAVRAAPGHAGGRRRAGGVDGRRVLRQPRPGRLGLGDAGRAPGQRRRGAHHQPAHGDPGGTGGGPGAARPLVVVSDSTYVVNCFRDGWWRGWIARGWLTSAKKPVVSRDLWEPLITLVNERGDVSFRWVKGHSGDPMNDLVDALAVEQSRAVA